MKTIFISIFLMIGISTRGMKTSKDYISKKANRPAHSAVALVYLVWSAFASLKLTGDGHAPRYVC
jgi:uncharacterized membrane-anchored protein YitT (DUF2179 family)